MIGSPSLTSANPTAAEVTKLPRDGQLQSAVIQPNLDGPCGRNLNSIFCHG
jgi:hypothetical protein